MSRMSRVCQILLFILTGIFFIHGDVDMRQLEDQSFFGFACFSSSDITIKYVSNETANNIQLIAECEIALYGCYLVAQYLGKYYAVFYTDRGAIFYVNTPFKETWGTYRCCETYNDEKCNSTHSQSISDNITSGNPNMDKPRQTKIGSGTLVMYGDIAFRPLEHQSLDVLECLSDSDIIIQFLSNDNANAIIIQTIAQCKTDLQGCFLLEQNFRKYYAVYYTDRGAIFYINGISDKTWGTYRCCETNNSKACDSTHIWSMSGNISTDKPEIDIPRQTIISSGEESRDTTNVKIIVNIALAVAAAFLGIWLIVVILRTRMNLNVKESTVLDIPTSNTRKHIYTACPSSIVL